MRIKIRNVSGIKEIKNALGKDAANRLEEAIELDLANGSRKMAVDAAKDSPVDTGALRASILSSAAREGKLTYYWGSRLPYALRQEYEHVPRKGWMRRSWEVGKKETAGDIRLTIRRKLGG